MADKKFEISANYKAVWLITITILLCAGGITAQEDVIRIDTNLVRVPVTVYDLNGKRVTGLDKEEFEIFENGVSQKISFFESTDQPLTVFLLIDESGSMYKHLVELASATSAFLNNLKPDDHVIMALFDDDLDYKVERSPVQEVLAGRKINLSTKKNIPPQTMVYSAVAEALKKMRNIEGRKAIVLFSDGISGGPSYLKRKNLRSAMESEAVIYTVQFETHSRKNPPKFVNKKEYFKKINKADEYLESLAELSGGVRLKIDTMDKLDTAFRQITEELSRQYSIGYYPQTIGRNGETRKIKVEVRGRKAAVRSKNKYVVGAVTRDPENRD